MIKLFRLQFYRCCCQLRATGSFSVAEMTSWLSHALSGELPRPAAKINFARSHALLGTLLICTYQWVYVFFINMYILLINWVDNIVRFRLGIKKKHFWWLTTTATNDSIISKNHPDDFISTQHKFHQNWFSRLGAEQFTTHG